MNGEKESLPALGRVALPQVLWLVHVKRCSNASLGPHLHESMFQVEQSSPKWDAPERLVAPTYRVTLAPIAAPNSLFHVERETINRRRREPLFHVEHFMMGTPDRRRVAAGGSGVASAPIDKNIQLTMKSIGQIQRNRRKQRRLDRNKLHI